MKKTAESLDIYRPKVLLFSLQSFDFVALGAGALFSILMSRLGVNTIMVLGGILMPTELAVSLLLGGITSYFSTQKEAYYPFFSGVFTANSLWIIIQAFF